MPLLVKAFGAALVLVVALIVGGMVYVRTTGLSARPEPGRVEARLARTVRSLAMPSSVRTRANEVPRSAEAVQEGLTHFADHCATCHANDGSGQTPFGRGLFPRPPDMRAGETQSLTDGELFSIIENGIRFTGMPAFADGTPEGEMSSWRLVHFIRELPRLTPAHIEQMAERNPRSPAEIRQEIAEEEFLKGGGRPCRPIRRMVTEERMMSRGLIVGVVLAAVLGVPVAARAHEGHAHKVMGTVTMRQDNRLEVKTTEGKTVTIVLNAKTTILRGKEKLDPAALRAGERVVVDTGDGKSPITAKEIKLGEVAAAAPVKKPSAP